MHRLLPDFVPAHEQVQPRIIVDIQPHRAARIYRRQLRKLHRLKFPLARVAMQRAAACELKQIEMPVIVKIRKNHLTPRRAAILRLDEFLPAHIPP